MSWTQLQLATDPENSQLLEMLLENLGAISVTMADAADQPLFEPGPGETPLWDAIALTALFEGDTEITQIIAQLEEEFQPQNLPEIKIESIPEQDWQRAWMDDFEPIQFGKRLWVCPSWCTPPDPEAVTMMLDPGLAFGSGTHPTTSLCLSWLDQQALNGLKLIDYGCGSGILGIAALLLGAAKVYGVDNDPQALIATIDNCHKNNISTELFPTEMPEIFAQQIITGKEVTLVDGMLANILAGPLIELSEYLSAMVKPGGLILLSGILENQADEVMKAYQPWFKIDPPETLEGWARITGTRLT